MCRVLIIAIAFAGAAPVAADVLKLATLAPEGSVWHVALRAMADDWHRISDGGISVRIYPGGVAGDDAAMVRKIRIGQLDGAALTADGMASIAPEMRVFQTPMLIRTNEELDFVRERLGGELETLAERRGFKLLAWSDVGWVYLFSKTPVQDPDSARRTRLWIAPGDTAWSEALKSAGYRPVALPATEILGGLQSGLVDAFNAPPVVALSSQWFGVASHMMDLRWSPLLGAVVVSTRFWERTPEAQRTALRASARTATARAQSDVRRFEAEAIQAMQQYGLTVHPVAAEDVARFEREIRDSYPKLVGPSIPEAIFNKASGYVDEYRRTR
jgi:TRAP-type C4-dicarboxylate transport system substrate-binding protein